MDSGSGVVFVKISTPALCKTCQALGQATCSDGPPIEVEIIEIDLATDADDSFDFGEPPDDPAANQQ